MSEPITSAQHDQFHLAYMGHTLHDQIMKVSRGLTKMEARDVISIFHGASYMVARHSPNPDIKAKAKAKLEAGIKALKHYGLKDNCGMCGKDRDICTCGD